MWLLITNIAILSPLYQQVTVWSLAICTICIIWRVGIYLGKVAKPPKWLVTTLAFASAMTLAMVANKIGVLTALINLLILGYALKYIEMRNRRDVQVVVLAGYFLIALTFIQQQSLWSTLQLLVVTFINTCVLISLYHDENNFKHAAKLGAKILLQSVPLAIILFVILPRLPPLWMVPPQGGAKTGLSNTVSFANITELTRSAELAFRATFSDNTLLQNSALYWRAIVMEDYDGTQWLQNPSIITAERGLTNPKSSNTAGLQRFAPVSNNVLNSAKALSYSVIAQPSSQHWLFGLDRATSQDHGINMLADFRLYASKPIDQQRLYNVTSYPNQPLEPSLSPALRAVNLSLPNNSNPRTTRLAMQFAAQYPKETDRLDAMMRYFTQQPYYYTLRPPAVGKQQIDNFLLDNKAGFCVHYASAFAFMARASGIPARLVSGYQGGEYNSAAGYYSVYQYMAHAWVEVWLPARGWVRFDPTAMIAPERIEAGFDAFFDPQESYLADSPFGYMSYRTSEMFNQLRMQFASVDYFWSVWVLGFNTDKQQRVLEEVLGEVTRIKLAMFIIVSLGVIGLSIAYSAGLIQFHRSKDRHLNAYYAVCKLLRKRNLPRDYNEGPLDYNQRVAAAFPSIAKDFDKLTRYYIAIKYQNIGNKPQKKLSRLLIKQSRWLKIIIIKQRLALNKTNT
ncbi:DUF3488 and DUF4129 domain-containing transglutaminase family protein [Shewanella gelidimarina]|uniref:transglutaminase TgpA family protein n=1 Tax=Shewanella gelidimarina TaxID=56813 RepID=UPI00200F75B0|nr:DUF3488 and DUF4129 domain-containing transglutaminase family protein [Shewanella gelidimarina]MCL1058201.1 DUF3488 and DUF4129 domain-containing transglutaminase family protein [Shewanella gelidimarina]